MGYGGVLLREDVSGVIRLRTRRRSVKPPSENCLYDEKCLRLSRERSGSIDQQRALTSTGRSRMSPCSQTRIGDVGISENSCAGPAASEREEGSTIEAGVPPMKEIAASALEARPRDIILATRRQIQWNSRIGSILVIQCRGRGKSAARPAFPLEVEGCPRCTRLRAGTPSIRSGATVYGTRKPGGHDSRE